MNIKWKLIKKKINELKACPKVFQPNSYVLKEHAEKSPEKKSQFFPSVFIIKKLRKDPMPFFMRDSHNPIQITAQSWSWNSQSTPRGH